MQALLRAARPGPFPQDRSGSTEPPPNMPPASRFSLLSGKRATPGREAGAGTPEPGVRPGP